jgi:lipoyl-dependent peroxiredoxin
VLLNGAGEHAREGGHAPASIDTHAEVPLRPVDGTPTITKIALTTVGEVARLDETASAQFAADAKAGCPVSRALAGVPALTLDATLA